MADDRYDRSRETYQRAQRVIPGGVNSPVRACRSVGADPLFIAQGDGATITDVDGNKYIDLIGSWGPLILGHTHPEILDTIAETMAWGTTFGAPTEIEVRFAETMREAIPSMEKVRAVSSGTEATMSALRLARGFTKRSKIVKADGGYHGHADCLLVAAGSGAATLGIPGSAGVPEGAARDTLVVPYNDLAAVAKCFADHPDDVAAVIIEPVAGNMGLVNPADGYLAGLRELTAKHGAILIFDEVITGFGRAGAMTGSAAFGVTPDIANYAKQITNGVQPLGAVIASKAIYDTFMAAGGPEYMVEFLHGYTYSAHPVACAAGVAALDLLVKDRAVERVAELAPYFENAVHGLRGFKHVADIRNFGLAAGLTIEAIPGEPAKRPYEIAMKCLANGHYVRYGGDTIQLAPPFIVEKAEIDRLISVLGDALTATD